MKIIAFDPSSSATGWAVMGDDPHVSATPSDSGLLKVPGTWHVRIRLECLHHDVTALLATLLPIHRVSRIVIETPGKAQAGRKRRVYSTPGEYAMAVGIVCGAAYSTGLQVVTVASDHWTRNGGFGATEKETRIKLLERISSYTRNGDPGGDRADAIMLGYWYLTRHGRDADPDLHMPPAKPYATSQNDRLLASTIAYGERGPRPIGTNRSRES